MRSFLMAMMMLLSTASAWATEVMTAEEARNAALSGEVILVDIRTPGEWAKTGLPDVGIAMDMTEPGFAQRLLDLYNAQPGRPVAVICASGARSTYVVTALRERGLDRMINVQEGMTGGLNGPGWLARNLPTRSPQETPAKK